MKSQKLYSRLNWTSEEQKYLQALYEQHQVMSWKLLSESLNEKFPGRNRSGKQCRERYMNYIKFAAQTNPSFGWTASEEFSLFEKFIKYGAKWVRIAKEMPGRSQNCLKNRFYGALRKFIRKIMNAQRVKKLRHRKIIKPELLIKVLECDAENPQGIGISIQKSNDPSASLKSQLIELAVNCDAGDDPDFLLQFMERLAKFNRTEKGDRKASNFSIEAVPREFSEDSEDQEWPSFTQKQKRLRQKVNKLKELEIDYSNEQHESRQEEQQGLLQGEEAQGIEAGITQGYLGNYMLSYLVIPIIPPNF